MLAYVVYGDHFFMLIYFEYFFCICKDSEIYSRKTISVPEKDKPTSLKTKEKKEKGNKKRKSVRNSVFIMCEKFEMVITERGNRKKL